MRISDWSSDVCSSDLAIAIAGARVPGDVREVRWPAGDDARWTVTIGAKDVAVDDASGEVATISTSRPRGGSGIAGRSEEHTSELQSLMRISYAVFCLKKKNKQ